MYFGTTISEKVLTIQDRKLSGNVSCASSPTVNISSKLAIDNSNSIHNFNICLSVPVDSGAGTGNTIRNLCPRHHMDKLSEYDSELIFK